jgi:uncharacterized Zn finger protein
VLYGIGARLDEHPELLFELRKVDESDLVAKAGRGLPLSKKRPAKDKVLVAGDLAALFGLEMGTSTGEPGTAASRAPRKPARADRAARPRSRPSAATARVQPARRQASAARRQASAGNGKQAPKAKAKRQRRSARRAPSPSAAARGSSALGWFAPDVLAVPWWRML